MYLLVLFLNVEPVSANIVSVPILDILLGRLNLSTLVSSPRDEGWLTVVNGPPDFVDAPNVQFRERGLLISHMTRVERYDQNNP